MNRIVLFLLTLVLLLITAHRLPAPIKEVETPTPTPVQKPNPTITTSPGKTARVVAKSTPKPATKVQRISKLASEPSETGKQSRFGGTWSGTMHTENGTTYQITVIVDPTETTASANGPVFANEEGPVKATGNTISWNWMLDRWSMTLNSETTAQIVKYYFSSKHTGTVQRIR